MCHLDLGLNYPLPPPLSRNHAGALLIPLPSRKCGGDLSATVSLSFQHIHQITYPLACDHSFPSSLPRSVVSTSPKCPTSASSRYLGATFTTFHKCTVRTFVLLPSLIRPGNLRSFDVTVLCFPGIPAPRSCVHLQHRGTSSPRLLSP
jgi:hypothetical protein